MSSDAIPVRRVLLLCDRWDSKAEGIAGVNMSLALALSKYSGIEVYSTLFSRVEELTKYDKDLAERNNIRLVSLCGIAARGDNGSGNYRSKTDELYVLLNEYPSDVFSALGIEVNCVSHIIGHSPVSAAAALRLRAELYSSSKVVLFYHVVASELERLSLVLPYVVPTDTEMVHLAESADVVYSVTEKMFDYYVSKFRTRSDKLIDHRLYLPQYTIEAFNLDRIEVAAQLPTVLQGKIFYDGPCEDLTKGASGDVGMDDVSGKTKKDDEIAHTRYGDQDFEIDETGGDARGELRADITGRTADGLQYGTGIARHRTFISGTVLAPSEASQAVAAERRVQSFSSIATSTIYQDGTITGSDGKLQKAVSDDGTTLGKVTGDEKSSWPRDVDAEGERAQGSKGKMAHDARSMPQVGSDSRRRSSDSPTSISWSHKRSVVSDTSIIAARKIVSITGKTGPRDMNNIKETNGEMASDSPKSVIAEQAGSGILNGVERRVVADAGGSFEVELGDAGSEGLTSKGIKEEGDQIVDGDGVMGKEREGTIRVEGMRDSERELASKGMTEEDGQGREVEREVYLADDAGLSASAGGLIERGEDGGAGTKRWEREDVSATSPDGVAAIRDSPTSDGSVKTVTGDMQTSFSYKIKEGEADKVTKVVEGKMESGFQYKVKIDHVAGTQEEQMIGGTMESGMSYIVRNPITDSVTQLGDDRTRAIVGYVPEAEKQDSAHDEIGVNVPIEMAEKETIPDENQETENVNQSANNDYNANNNEPPNQNVSRSQNVSGIDVAVKSQGSSKAASFVYISKQGSPDGLGNNLDGHLKSNSEVNASDVNSSVVIHDVTGGNFATEIRIMENCGTRPEPIGGEDFEAVVIEEDTGMDNIDEEGSIVQENTAQAEPLESEERLVDYPTLLRILVLCQQTSADSACAEEYTDWNGIDVAALAVVKAAQVLPPTYRHILVVGGVTPSGVEATKARLQALVTEPNIDFSVHSYESPVDLLHDLASHSLCLVPSRCEPYGHVGLFALSAGIPTLVAQESSLASFVQRLSAEPEQFLVPVTPTSTAVRQDASLWRDRILAVLNDPVGVTRRALQLQNALRLDERTKETHDNVNWVCVGGIRLRHHASKLRFLYESDIDRTLPIIDSFNQFLLATLKACWRQKHHPLWREEDPPLDLVQAAVDTTAVIETVVAAIEEHDRRLVAVDPEAGALVVYCPTADTLNDLWAKCDSINRLLLAAVLNESNSGLVLQNFNLTGATVITEISGPEYLVYKDEIVNNPLCWTTPSSESAMN